MSYSATLPIEFPCGSAAVYEALCDLEHYPLWNSGMRWVSTPGPLVTGLEYETESIAAGHTIRSRLRVVRMVREREIELESKSGAIAFEAMLRLEPLAPDRTRVVCELKFTFQNFVLDLARPVIESMVQARLRGDLETLRALVCGV